MNTSLGKVVGLLPASVGSGPTGSDDQVGPETAKHHVFPQRAYLKAKFLKAGIDPDLFCLRIPSLLHQEIYGGGPLGGEWNNAWVKFFDENPNATDIEIYKYAGKLLYEFEIPGVPIIHY